MQTLGPASPSSTVTRALLAAGFVVLLASVLSCATSVNQLPQEPGFSPRLTRFTYLEEGKLVTLAADMEATRKRDDQKFIPVSVGIANSGLPTLTLTRESFTLVDDKGNKYSLATVSEARSLASLQTYDVRIAVNFRDVFFTRFSTWPQIPMVFFPVQSSDPEFARRGIVRDRVEMPLRSWAWDILYFPHPQGSIKDRKFELWLDTPELEEPVFVRFAVK